MSASGCSIATHVMTSLSYLTGRISSLCMRQKHGVPWNVKKVEEIATFCIMLCLCEYKYRVRRQQLFVLSFYIWQLGFDLGFYIALVSSKETDSSYSLLQITEMPCLHSQLCDFAKHTKVSAEWHQEGGEGERKNKEQGQTHAHFESRESPQLQPCLV